MECVHRLLLTTDAADITNTGCLRVLTGSLTSSVQYLTTVAGTVTAGQTAIADPLAATLVAQGMQYRVTGCHVSAKYVGSSYNDMGRCAVKIYEGFFSDPTHPGSYGDRTPIEHYPSLRQGFSCHVPIVDDRHFEFSDMTSSGDDAFKTHPIVFIMVTGCNAQSNSIFEVVVTRMVELQPLQGSFASRVATAPAPADVAGREAIARYHQYAQHSSKTVMPGSGTAQDHFQRLMGYAKSFGGMATAVGNAALSARYGYNSIRAALSSSSPVITEIEDAASALALL